MDKAAACRALALLTTSPGPSSAPPVAPDAKLFFDVSSIAATQHYVIALDGRAPEEQYEPVDCGPVPATTQD
jgi:hypothetical protein